MKLPRKSTRPGDVIELKFLHPRNSSMNLTADISPLCTGEEALEELMRDEDGTGPFLPSLPDGQAYELGIRRTVQCITSQMTFQEAGAIDGDLIDVRQKATGGGPGWLELGQMFFWSAAAASVFLKSAAPIIVEFLRSRSSRSITVHRGEDKIVITGTDADKAMELWKLLENRPTDERGSKSLEQSDRLTPPITVTLNDSKRIDSTGVDSA